MNLLKDSLKSSSLILLTFLFSFFYFPGTSYGNPSLKVGKSFIEVKVGPGLRFETLAKVKKGEILYAVGKKGIWYQVRLPHGDIGWVLQYEVYPPYRNKEESSKWFELGHKLFVAKRKYTDSLSCFNNAIKIYSKNHRAWNSKGLVLLRLKRYKEALRCFEKALNINPLIKTYWLNKAKAHLRLKELIKAKECMLRAKDVTPKLFVRVKDLVVRKKPSFDSEMETKKIIPFGSMIKVVEKKDEWFLISGLFGKILGWVHMATLTKSQKEIEYLQKRNLIPISLSVVYSIRDEENLLVTTLVGSIEAVVINDEFIVNFKPNDCIVFNDEEALKEIKTLKVLGFDFKKPIPLILYIFAKGRFEPINVY